MSTLFHLLLVDDDPLIGPAIKMILPANWRLIYSPGASMVNITFPYHAAFVDMHLQNPSNGALGLKVIEKLRSSQPLLEIVAISGDLSLELMEQGLSCGAQRFLAKPLIADEVLLHLRKIEALIEIRQAAQNAQFEGPRWVGTSAESERIRQEIAALRGEQGPILISGESGCGKEVASRLIHSQEGRGPLISVNMASITETLFESEFFGHIKGAFTGADSNKIGLVEAASGGDLFLDEIEALPPALQAKMLRFLETGEFKKVGNKETQFASCRVFCATNRDLAEMVRNGQFREDLYWRISGKKVNLSPLRERLGDIETLADFFLGSDRPKRNKKFAPDGIAALEAYHWPGNIRELKRVCEQLSLTSPLPVIRGVDVRAILSYSNTQVTMADFDFSLGLNELANRFEAQVIKKALPKFKNDIDKVADLLKISRSSLYKKIKEYEIEIKS
jgi:DNA-binding NtrC family response regulator